MRTIVVAGIEFYSFIYINKNTYLLSSNAQVLSRHNSKVSQDVRLLVFLHKMHIQTHINWTADGREKKSVRLQCGLNILSKFCKDANLGIRHTILNKQMECLIWFFHLYCFWFTLSLKIYYNFYLDALKLFSDEKGGGRKEYVYIIIHLGKYLI